MYFAYIRGGFINEQRKWHVLYARKPGKESMQ